MQIVGHELTSFNFKSLLGTFDVAKRGDVETITGFSGKFPPHPAPAASDFAGTCGPFNWS
jgi:hypothetical protein